MYIYISRHLLGMHIVCVSTDIYIYIHGYMYIYIYAVCVWEHLTRYNQYVRSFSLEYLESEKTCLDLLNISFFCGFFPRHLTIISFLAELVFDDSSFSSDGSLKSGAWLRLVFSCFWLSFVFTLSLRRTLQTLPFMGDCIRPCTVSRSFFFLMSN